MLYFEYAELKKLIGNAAYTSLFIKHTGLSNTAAEVGESIFKGLLMSYTSSRESRVKGE